MEPAINKKVSKSHKVDLQLQIVPSHDLLTKNKLTGTCEQYLAI